MKKKMKNSLLSVLLATTATTAVAGAALIFSPNVNSATAETQTTRFEMVDGASIRFSEPLGMRFIAELGEKEYAELATGTKTMGVFVMQYSDIDTDEDGTIDVTDYAGVSKKLNYEFYKTGETIEKGLYEYTDEESGETYYRANAVIDLSLKNYAKEFVGVGYIAETVNGNTTYEYTDISYSDNVRTAAYVAIEAHADPDYKEIDNAMRAFTQYIDGAQLYSAYSVTENDAGKYVYQGAEYDTLAEIKGTIENYAYGISLDKTVKYVKADGTAQLSATLSDTQNNVTFKGAHAVYSSSDESVVKVDKTGKLTHIKNGTATITAEFMGKTQTCEVISGAVIFDDMTNVPAYFRGSRIQTFSIVDDTAKAGKAMRAQTTSDSTGDTAIFIKTATLGAFFEDSTIEYFAFDVMTDADRTTLSDNLYNVTYHDYRTNPSGVWTRYENGNHKYNCIPSDAFKTYYFPRAVYQSWVDNNLTDARFLLAGPLAKVYGGDSFYLDNLRGVTAEEYENSHYSFERGNLRTDNGSAVLFYSGTDAGWDLQLNNLDQTTAKFTNAITSDGGRAFTFKKKAGKTELVFNHTTDTTMEKQMRNAGYIAYDLYVPEGSNASAVLDNTSGVYATLKQGWNTLYAKIDATGNTASAFWDSTASTYVIDNIRLLTAEEYNTEMLSFEGKAGVLRDSISSNKTVYIYTPRDTVENRWTMAIEGGGCTLSDPQYSTEVVKDGKQSLAFHKTNGYMSMALNTGGEMYAQLKNGFTFWVYADLDVQSGINGTSATNFIDGGNNKFNGGAGINVTARQWTLVTVPASSINASGRFLIIQGSTAGTYYFDGFRPLTNYEITLDAGAGSVESTTQTVTYGASYTLEAPTPAEGYKFVGWYYGEELIPTTGTWTIDGNVTLTAKYEELPKYFYNATGERTEDGSVTDLVLNGGTHNAGTTESTAMPIASEHTTDMAYYRFHGDYGLNDFLVFDVTGENMPIVSFFTSDVKNSVYNHAQSEEEKAWIFFNGVYNHNGLPDGGYSGALSNRLNLIGPYKITYKADNSWASGLAGSESPKSARIGDGSNATNPNPVSLAQLNGTTDEYRVMLGWVENESNTALMSLRVYVWNLTTGAVIRDQVFSEGRMTKADWTGDIALYGHFGKTTTVNKVYPIVEGFDNAKAKYTPAMQTYNATWNGNGLTLGAGYYESGGVSKPKAGTTDMAYVAFNGDYGVGDYVVFDFTGENMPVVSFFNNEVTNTVYNNADSTADSKAAADDNAHGIVICGGMYNMQKQSGLGAVGTNVNSCRLIIVGNKKVLSWDDGSNAYRVADGTTSAPNPLSITELQGVTDTYRVIMGFSAAGTLEVRVINMVTGAQVYSWTKTGLTSNLETGSIAIHGQFGKETVLDSVFGVEEDTTISALLTKYAKDSDYSDEDTVVLNRYAYSGPSHGQWTIDGVNQVENVVDYRTVEQYTQYKNAGFNILLAQDSISVSASTWNSTGGGKEIMDRAHEAGLKVILTDGRIQGLSEPVTISSGSVNGTAWKIGSGEKFSNQASLDLAIMEYLSLYKDHPAFYGVMLGDEPSYQNAWCYGQVYQSIKRVMPECYVQYNLNPMQHGSADYVKLWCGGTCAGSTPTDAETEAAYKSYVNAFLDAMGTDYIQYDDYPFKSAKASGISGWLGGTDPYIDPTALRNIQMVAEIARDRNLDVKVVTQSCLMRSGGEKGYVAIRQVTEDDARWLNNYLMGFGVKQISYFTYWTKSANSDSGEWFDDGGAFVKRDGTTTALYDIMKTIMAENTAFAKTISHFDYNASKVVTNSYKYADEHIVWGTLSSDSFKWVTGVTTSTDATLVTELYDKENYNYMYMVMNTIDPNEKNANKKDTKQTITVTLDSSITEFYVYDQSGNRSLVTGNTYTATLTAGQAVYLMPKF